MDYKYIEQLLDKYWRCETTLQEEAILRTFFSQDDVPDSLAKYRELFVLQHTEGEELSLGDDFDSKILSLTEEKETKTVKAITIPLATRLKPLFKAAAVVAMIVTLGNAAQLSFNSESTDEEIDYANIKDTYNDPQAAYDKMENALQLVSEGLVSVKENDSLAMAKSSIVTNDSLR